MKHIFIINPAAGKCRAGKVFLPVIIETAKSMEIDYEIHRSINIGDAERFIRSRCQNRNDECETLRFYGCGGDGTLNEVANGAYGYENVEIAIIPAGTGNDFIRNFGNKKAFTSIKRQIEGIAQPIDLIQYKSDNAEPRYCINMFNIGLECNVAAKVGGLKKYPFISGPFAYGVGAGIVLAQNEFIDLEIEFDDGTSYSGEMRIMAIANGCYCGGGFKGVPLAKYNDGIIDVSIVKNVSRAKLIRLLGPYRRGTHLEMPMINDIVIYKKCKELRITPKNKMELCTDGEVSSVFGEVLISIVPKAIRFSIPK